MLCPFVGSILSRMLAGAIRAASESHCALFPVNCRRDRRGRLVFDRSPGGGTLSELLSLLRPDGIIVAHNAVSGTAVHAAARASGLPAPPPIVFLGEPVATSEAAYVHGDERSFAELALRELLVSGFDDFAYAASNPAFPWDKARRTAFERLVTLAGKRFHVFDGYVGKDGKSRVRPPATPNGRMSSWLADLPKPCGIFAANDVVGEQVLRAAADLGLRVPGDVAVVGVDDLAHVCEVTTPTLSSVRRDLEGEGMAAVKMLCEWLGDGSQRGACPQPHAVPAASLVRRASSNFSVLRDTRVTKAQEFIRIHACDHDMRPAKIFRDVMYLSRTQADRLFRTITGHSILDEIHSVRIERAKEKLRAGTAPSLVAAECGYGSYLNFRRVFRNLTGDPVCAWARKMAKSAY